MVLLQLDQPPQPLQNHTSRHTAHHKALTHTKNIDEQVFLPHAASPRRHPIQFPIKKQQNITAYIHAQTTYNGITRPGLPCLPPSMIFPPFHSGAFAGCQKGFLSLRSSLPSFKKKNINAKIDLALRLVKTRKRDSLAGTQTNKREVDKTNKQIPRARERGEVRGPVLRSVCVRYSLSRELNKEHTQMTKKGIKNKQLPQNRKKRNRISRRNPIQDASYRL